MAGELNAWKARVNGPRVDEGFSSARPKWSSEPAFEPFRLAGGLDSLPDVERTRWKALRADGARMEGQPDPTEQPSGR